mmetsp:Transcript_19837/g.59462  ORF Transcript_19837/g.59462 Transcript_19837/m.59462 type:complete len:792 (+) Transcript_19837:248-2623(+)
MLHLLELPVGGPQPLLLGGDRRVDVLQPVWEVCVHVARPEHAANGVRLLLADEGRCLVPLRGHLPAQEVLRARQQGLRLGALFGALGLRPRLHGVGLVVHGVQDLVRLLDVADQGACELEQLHPVEKGRGVPLHLRAALPEDEVQLLHGHVREGFGHGSARDDAVGRPRVSLELLLDCVVPHPRPRLQEAEEEVADGLPDGLADKGGFAHLAVDVQDDGQHQVEHQQHDEDQERPGPHRGSPVELRRHFLPVVVALEDNPEAATYRPLDRREGLDASPEHEAAGDGIRHEGWDEDDHEVQEVGHHSLHRLQDHGEARLRAEADEEAEHEHHAVLPEDDAHVRGPNGCLLALGEEVLDDVQVGAVQVPTEVSDHLQLPSESVCDALHDVEAVDVVPAEEDDEALAHRVRLVHVAQEGLLEEGLPHVPRPLQRACRQDQDEAEVSHHAVLAGHVLRVVELQEDCLQVSLEGHAAGSVRREGQGELLQARSAQLRIHQVHPYLHLVRVPVQPPPPPQVLQARADRLLRLRGEEPEREPVLLRLGLQEAASQLHAPEAQPPRRGAVVAAPGAAVELVLRRRDLGVGHEALALPAHVAGDGVRAVVRLAVGSARPSRLLEAHSALQLVELLDAPPEAPPVVRLLRQRDAIDVCLLEEDVQESLLAQQRLPDLAYGVDVHEYLVRAAADRRLREVDVHDVLVQPRGEAVEEAVGDGQRQRHAARGPHGVLADDLPQHVALRDVAASHEAVEGEHAGCLIAQGDFRVPPPRAQRCPGRGLRRDHSCCSHRETEGGPGR